MDSNIILSSSGKTLSTVISNKFIDNFMADANGGFVKVYVYLLRLNQDPTRNVSIPLIAEELDETEKDIRTALKYWADKGVLSLTKRGNVITGITVHDLDDYDDNERASFMNNSGTRTCSSDNSSEDFSANTPESFSDNGSESFSEAVGSLSDNISGSSRNSRSNSAEAPEERFVGIPSDRSRFGTVTVDKTSVYDESQRPNYTAKIMNSFKATLPDYRSLLVEIENLYGSPLTQNDMKEVTYIYEQLGFPVELISYLYDYCINSRKKNPRERGFINYVDATAIEWDKAGIKTLEMARQEVESFSSSAMAVKKALGLSERLKPAQIDIIKKWSKEYGFSDELIVEACNRSVLQAKGANPSLKYIDSMLTDWHNQNVTSLSDIKKLDEDHQKNRDASKKSETGSRRQKSPDFDYSQRSYTDEELKQQERQKLHRSLINK